MPRASKKVEDAYNRIFAVRLRQLLEEQGKSQSELASELGIQRQSVNAYTLGITVPDIDRFKEIAKYFKVSYDYLLGDSDAKNRENIEVTKELGLSEYSVVKLKDIHSREMEKGLFGYIDLINVIVECLQWRDILGPVLGYREALKAEKAVSPPTESEILHYYANCYQNSQKSAGLGQVTLFARDAKRYYIEEMVKSVTELIRNEMPQIFES